VSAVRSVARGRPQSSHSIHPSELPKRLRQ
jgi:hypothetical protein